MQLQNGKGYRKYVVHFQPFVVLLTLFTRQTLANKSANARYRQLDHISFQVLLSNYSGILVANIVILIDIETYKMSIFFQLTAKPSIYNNMNIS